MVLTVILFIFLIYFVVMWARTNKLTHQISASLFLILIYVNGNFNVIKENQRYNEAVLKGVMLIIDQNELTQDIVDEKTEKSFAQVPKYHKA